MDAWPRHGAGRQPDLTRADEVIDGRFGAEGDNEHLRDHVRSRVKVC